MRTIKTYSKRAPFYNAFGRGRPWLRWTLRVNFRRALALTLAQASLGIAPLLNNRRTKQARWESGRKYYRAALCTGVLTSQPRVFKAA